MAAYEDLGSDFREFLEQTDRNSYVRKFIEETDSNSYAGVGRGEAEFSSSRDFDSARWKKHASLTRYGREVIGLFLGTTTRRILPILVMLGIFATLVEAYSYLSARNSQLPEFNLPAAPFELTAPLLGLLLVFRTNSSYERFAAGSRAVHSISGNLQDLLRQLLTWTSDGRPRATSEVAHICDLVVLYHRWLCTDYLLMGQHPEGKGKESRASLNRRLGRADAAPLTPALVHLALSWEMNRVPYLELPQRQGLETTLVRVNAELNVCCQLLRTPIPLAYTRSLLRFLNLWLTLLPFSLVRTFTDFNKGTWWENQPLFVVPLTTCFIGLVFLSLEDIAVQIEEPFVVQSDKLERLSSWFQMDADEMRDLTGRLQAREHYDPVQLRAAEYNEPLAP